MKQIILFFFITYASMLSAQEGFINAYNFGYSSAVRINTMILDDSELVVAGYLRDSIFPYQQGIFLTKLDTLGNEISITTHYDSLGNNYSAASRGYPGGLIKLNDNSGYLFTGNVFEGSDGFLAKFDLAGNFVWLKRLEDSVSLSGHYRKLLETDTGFLIGGSKQVPNGNQTDMFLLKTDMQGNVLWEQQYGDVNNTDLFQNIIALNSNEYVLGVATALSGIPQIRLLAVDSLGVEKWSMYSETPMASPNIYDNQGCYGLQHEEDTGNWVYATRRIIYEGPGVQIVVGKFVVRDSSFNLITEREYDEVEGIENYFLNLVPLSDGDWLGLGVNYEQVENPVQALAHNYGHLARISNGKDGMTNLGDTLWTRSDIVYPDTAAPQQLFMHSAVELPGGNIIAAGYFTGFGYVDHGILIKVNQHGCIDTLNCIPTNFPNITITNKVITTPNLKVYPNPARHILHYESDQIPLWDKVELLDMTGQVVKTETYNKEITMDGLPSGLYILRLWKGQQFWTRKVIVE